MKCNNQIMFLAGVPWFLFVNRYAFHLHLLGDLSSFPIENKSCNNMRTKTVTTNGKAQKLYKCTHVSWGLYGILAR